MRIDRRRAVEFFGLVQKHHQQRIEQLRTGVLAVITVPKDLPTDAKAQRRLADDAVRHALHRTVGDYDIEGAHIRVGEVDPARLAAIRTATPRQARDLTDELSGTRNREVMAVGTLAGGALMMVIQSAQEDALLDNVFDTLRDSAARQLTGTRAALFVVGFDGMGAEQLLSVAREDQEPGAVPSALTLHTSRFLESTSRDQIVGVTFLSASALRPAVAGAVDSGGVAYHFARHTSKFWSEQLRGLFNRGATLERVDQRS